jgi:outer membrane protein assembly factor BamB
LRKVSGLGFSLLFILSGALSSLSSVAKGPIVLEKELAYPYSDGAAFCQGITTDGTYFYGTGCIKYLNYNAIVKIDAETGEIVRINDMCLPASVVRMGYSHLGDCAYHDGKIYAACEAFFFKDPAVMVFEAETLGFIGYHVLPEEGRGNGHIPWVCVKDGTVYYTQAREVDEVRLLRLDDFSFAGTVKMDRTVTKITGGDVLNGRLYLSSNSGGNEKITYAVDLETGETTEAFVRDMGNVFTEAEGLSVAESANGPIFHYLDVAFVSKAVIRTYGTEG